MNATAMSTNEIEQRIIELDDEIEDLVARIDEEVPGDQTAIYGDIEKRHDEIFRLRAALRSRPDAA